MKIKICGMVESENIKAVAALLPDYMGFIFYPPSPRYAADKLNASLLSRLPESIHKTGVFVNEDYDTIMQHANKFHLQTIQLHGNENVELTKKLKEKGLEVFKVISISAVRDFRIMSKYEGIVDYFLLDTKTPAYGGSGITFDWSILTDYPSLTPFFLSGGIDLKHLEKIRALKIPQLAGIDVNSQFEIVPGRKDANKLMQLFKLFR